MITDVELTQTTTAYSSNFLSFILSRVPPTYERFPKPTVNPFDQIEECLFKEGAQAIIPQETPTNDDTAAKIDGLHVNGAEYFSGSAECISIQFRIVSYTKHFLHPLP